MDGEARSERLEEENKSGGDDLDSFRLLFLRGAWAVMAVVGGGVAEDTRGRIGVFIGFK